MRSAWTMVACLMVMGGACAQENAVKNPDFRQVDPRDPGAPADWRLPDGGHWALVAGAPDGGVCLGYESEGSLDGPVRQQIDFLTPGSTYELRARLKCTGGLYPVIVVRDTGEQQELAKAQAGPESQWQTMGLRFEPVTADVAIEIYAAGQHTKGEPSNAGHVWITHVEVVKIADGGMQQQIPDLGENLALGASYEMSPANYGYSRDEGDKTQLTDGEYSEGHFWTRPTTVGWTGTSLKFVKLDLGQVRAIGGMSFNTAAGVAGVTWPASIIVYVSDDGEAWYEVADLVQLHEQHDSLPPYGQYSVIRLWTNQLHTHGRWVQLVIEPGGPYSFCDEIEVFRGEDAWLAEAHGGEAVADVQQRMGERRITRLIGEQFTRDLEAVRADIRDLPEAARGALWARADELAAAIAAMAPIPMEGFVAILPMTDLERDIFALQAEVWRAQGKPPLRIWHQHRWDPLAPSAEPLTGEAPGLSVHMMNNEHRADVLNITNAGERDVQLQVRVTGLPGGDNPDWIAVHQVEHVGTRHFTSVAAALPEARRNDAGWLVTVPAGMTRQIWVAINRPDLPAGGHTAAVEVRSAAGTLSAPLRLRIYPLRFPDESTLLVGGWEYTDGVAYGLTEDNLMAFLRHMHEHYVNAPWATGAALPRGKFDAAGEMIEEPETVRFDGWMADWPWAKMYMVFLGQHPGSRFEGADPGTELFNKQVGQWARFWADHMVELGKDPSQLGVLIIDEPHDQAQYDGIVDWARAIEAAAPEIVTWEDPQPSDPEQPREMFETVDVLCPYRRQYLTRPPWYPELIAEMQAQGKDVWLYSADGPARTFDPFSYYLMQEWHAFAIGGKGSNFWCFSDNGRVSCWNEYPAPGNGPYCPIYIDESSITAAKYMEAIREGIEDFEYLTMLRARIEELQGKGITVPQATKDLLANGPARVLAGEEGANYRWDEPKDRSVQDAVRIEVLRALTELAELQR